MNDTHNNYLNELQKSSKAVDTALSSYEKKLIDQVLKQKEAEQAAAKPVNDFDPDTLRYLFGIFH